MVGAYPDIESLALFVTICESGSISAAARAHGISQPAATGRLRQLERRLGLSLVVRSTSGCTPTSEGSAVAEWAKEELASAGRLVAGAEALRVVTPGASLRLTASYTTAEYLLPQALVDLRRRSPGIALTMSVANSKVAIDDVLTGRSHLGFVEGVTTPKGANHQSVANDRLVVIAAADNPAGRTRPLQPKDLVSSSLVLRENGSGTREVFERALERASVELHTSVLELGSTAAILRAVAIGDALGVVSELAARAFDHSNALRIVPTRGLDFRRSLQALWIAEHASDVAEVVAAAARAGEHLAPSGAARHLT